MNVFLTGGSSPLGEAVLHRLTEMHRVAALARSEISADAIRSRGAFPVEGTLENPDLWLSELHDAEAVVHLAGMQFIGSIAPYVAHKQSLIVIGSASMRNPAHPNAKGLRTAEAQLAHAKPGGLAVLRPTMIYGSPRDRNVRLLANAIKRLPFVPRLIGGGLIQPILVDDVADAITATLGTTDRVCVDLGGGSRVRLGDLVAGLATLLGKPIAPLPVPVMPLAWVSGLAHRRWHTRGLHALAMLRYDRVVAPTEPRVMGHAPTELSEGLRIALARYGDGAIA